MSVSTLWHKLRDAVPGPHLSVVRDATRASPVREVSHLFDATAFEAQLDASEGIPRFVVPETLVRLCLTDQGVASVADMEDCGVLNLPYPACVVEYDASGTRYHVTLCDAPAEDAAEGYRWRALAVASYREGPATVPMAFPVMFSFGYNAGDGAGDGADADRGRFHYRASLPSYMRVGAGPADGELAAMMASSADIAWRRCGAAFLAAVLLGHTLGLERSEVGDRDLRPANRLRRAIGRRPIPPHTLIRLASYAAADGGTRSYDGRSAPEVFLRRGHKRRVATGAGRTGRRWRWFPAQVVGYLPDGRKPTVVEVLATRAARPYVVRMPEGADA